MGNPQHLYPSLWTLSYFTVFGVILLGDFVQWGWTFLGTGVSRRSGELEALGLSLFLLVIGQMLFHGLQDVAPGP